MSTELEEHPTQLGWAPGRTVWTRRHLSGVVKELARCVCGGAFQVEGLGLGKAWKSSDLGVGHPAALPEGKIWIENIGEGASLAGGTDV